MNKMTPFIAQLKMSDRGFLDLDQAATSVAVNQEWQSQSQCARQAFQREHSDTGCYPRYVQ